MNQVGAFGGKVSDVLSPITPSYAPVVPVEQMLVSNAALKVGMQAAAVAIPIARPFADLISIEPVPVTRLSTPFPPLALLPAMAAGFAFSMPKAE